MQSVCVFLGANFGNNQLIQEEIENLGKEIAEKNLTMIYGGSSLGMMGLLATSVKKFGGKVVGVITNHLSTKEQLLTTLDELHLVESMQARKQMMHNLADCFIVFPGGLGTLEEALETWNAIKIGALEKKIAFLNIDGYFDGLFTFVNSCQENGFLTQEQQLIPIVSSNSKHLLELLTQDMEHSCSFG